MPQSLARNLIHLVFATKNREPVIHDAVRERLHRYIAGICGDLDSPLIAVNSVADHIHILFVLSKNRALADVVMEVKRGSSKYAKTLDAGLARFQWQAGYGAFSIGESGADALTAYIADQAERHRRMSFQDELRGFFRRYGVEFDEHYVWD